MRLQECCNNAKQLHFWDFLYSCVSRERGDALFGCNLYFTFYILNYVLYLRWLRKQIKRFLNGWSNCPKMTAFHEPDLGTLVSAAAQVLARAASARAALAAALDSEVAVSEMVGSSFLQMFCGSKKRIHFRCWLVFSVRTLFRWLW